MNKWLFNPFVYIAGTKALAIGWVAMLLTAVTGYYSNTHFDGLIDVHTGQAAPIAIFFVEQLVNWASAVILFYIAGITFSTSAVRLIDIAGTFALARWVMLFPALLGFGIKVPQAIHTMAELQQSITGTVILLAFFTLLFIVWLVTLMYNAFVVSTNIKGGKAIAVFIAVLIAAELLSHTIIHLLYSFKL